MVMLLLLLTLLTFVVAHSVVGAAAGVDGDDAVSVAIVEVVTAHP